MRVFTPATHWAPVTHNFKRDGSGVTSSILNDGSAAYTPGISERRGSDTTYMHSGIKNAERQTDVNEDDVATRTYDAFGNLTAASGTWQGPFGHAGQFGYQEDASGYQLLGHRFYDPTIGRFLTRDPIKDGRNWYVYCENSPVAAYDADGLRLKIIGGTQAQRDAIMGALLTLLLSPTAREWVRELLYGETVYTIIIQGGNAGTHVFNTTIFINLEDISDDWYQGEHKKLPMWPVDLVLVLGNELAHLIGKVPGDGTAETEQASNELENQIAAELGYPGRRPITRWTGIIDGPSHGLLPRPIIAGWVPLPFHVGGW